MADDIVALLLALNHPVADDAADEIERLRAQVAELLPFADAGPFEEGERGAGFRVWSEAEREQLRQLAEQAPPFDPYQDG